MCGRNFGHFRYSHSYRGEMQDEKMFGARVLTTFAVNTTALHILYVRKEETFLVPAHYVDLMRQTRTSIANGSEHTLNDYWNGEGEGSQRNGLERYVSKPGGPISQRDINGVNGRLKTRGGTQTGVKKRLERKKIADREYSSRIHQEMRTTSR